MSKNTTFLDFIQNCLSNFDNTQTSVLKILMQCKFIWKTYAW